MAFTIAANWCFILSVLAPPLPPGGLAASAADAKRATQAGAE